ncbi:hypothetical protein G7068_06620 [Leucobacter viscericola]|uniref:HTH luxR-type domain-containing protein n=1 Tax=Leucobacter viscericola TaxID=2714935 RepID=A0A6G7XEV7_9MICO|nr:LuxR family transcriptional regulator [Leucobacter viscericola]QIK62908.1 hypothetical protein G7068_06620 [Leucobacter viscericola]
MSDRMDSLRFGVETLLSGENLDVVGMRGSGRTLFLNDLIDRLGDEGWKAVRIRGNASLASVNFGALMTAGILPGTAGPGKSQLATAIDSLLEYAGEDEFVFVVDNWDDLDESTWGVIEVVRQRTRHPVAVSRLLGRKVRQTPSGLHSASSTNALVATVDPLRFAEMTEMAEAQLGGSVDPTTLSRLYAKSGGLAGIATKMLASGALSGRLVQRNGVWIAVRSLWSPALNGVLEAYLEPLNAGERDAVQTIALAGVCDVETLRDVVDWSILESLEASALLKVYASGTRQLVTLYPPALVEYLRSDSQRIQKIRLTDVLLSKLGTQPLAPFAVASPDGHLSSEDGAIFTRLTHEQAQTRAQVTYAEWKREPSAETARHLIRAMHVVGSTPEEFVTIFETPLQESNNYSAEADYLCLRAEWMAYETKDVDGAIALLESAPERWGSYRRISEAFSVTLQSSLRRIPEDYASILEITHDLPSDVEIALLRSQMYVLISVGRFEAAQRAYDRVDALSRLRLGNAPNALYGIALLGQGRADSALAWARQGYEDSRNALDFEAVRTHASALVYCLEADGRFDDAEEILSAIFPAGRPPRLLESASAQFVLEVTSGLIAARSGEAAQAEASLSAVQEMGLPDGPMPNESVAILRAQVLIGEGKPDEAAEVLWASGQDLLDRGMIYAGVLLQLSSIRTSPNDERLEEAAQTAKLVEGEFVAALVDYLRFVSLGNGDNVEELADRLVRAGRSGLAILALDHAIRWDHEQQGGRRSAQLVDFRVQLIQSLPANHYEVAGYNPQVSGLTTRETEVAVLIAKGLTNRQIAERLVLSVRTVETHVRHILRKTNSATRDDVQYSIQVDR